MKRNIVLIDLDFKLYKSIYESKLVNIELLITENNEAQLKEIRDSYGIKNIITRDKFHEFTEKEAINISYETIEKFKATQLDSEHYQDRFSDDANLKQYRYYSALSFWIKVFNDNKISAVIADRILHGANYDSLALDVAKSYGIPGYVIENFMFRYFDDSGFVNRAVLNYSLKKWVPLDHEKLGLKHSKIEDYLFYPEKNNKNINKKRSFKEFLKLFLPSYGKLMSLRKIILRQEIFMHGLGSHPGFIYRNILHVKTLRRFYNSITKKFDSSRKYLFYALHFEPEASIMARARLNNQLFIIKQISQSLPKGWILYVKDHPDQLENYDRPGLWYFLISIHKYRTKNFYKKLNKLDNVCLIDTNIKSQDIIKSAEGISTINGSIALEALHYKKPLLLFGHQNSPLGLLKDVFKITSTEHCHEALNSLESGFTPEYSDLNDIVDKYFFETEFFSENDLQLLIDYLVLNNESCR